jgi:hypothetical protein
MLIVRQEMKPPREIVNECASAIHKAVLKPIGYKKSGFNWTLAGEWTRIINLQLLRWNSADEVQFTLNFGVFIPDLHRIAERPPRDQPLAEPDCVIRARYGSLTPSRLDHWWKVDAVTDPAELIRDVTGAVVAYGLPWLASLADYSSVAANYERKKDLFMAGLAYHLAGQEALATERIKVAIEKANTHFKPRAIRIANQLNLIKT